jgi:hypothetical protein
MGIPCPADTTESSNPSLITDRPRAGLFLPAMNQPVSVLPIPPWDVPALWPVVAPLLEKALARQTEMGLDEVRQLCMNQSLQLWYLPDSHALVTQIQNHPRLRICMIVLCGGEGLWQRGPAMEALEGYARAMQCQELRIQGRRGWARVLGFEPIATVMRKKL